MNPWRNARLSFGDWDEKKNIYFNLVLLKLKGKLCFENIEISIGRNIYILLTQINEYLE